MKNFKKILIVLLALAITFACSAVFAFAADDSDYQSAYEAALIEHKKVLEYYEAGYYLNADFDGATDLESAFADASDEFSFVAGGAFESELDAENGTAHISSVNKTYFDFVPETPSSFGIKAKVKISAGSSFDLFLHSSERGEIGDYLRLFSISEGKVVYKLDCSGSVPKYVSDNESAVLADTYFNLDFFLTKKATSDVMNLVITPEGGEAKEYVFEYDNTSTDFLNGKFDFNSFYIATEDATIDALQVYKGSFTRDLDNTKNIKLIADNILEIKADYDKYYTKVDGNAYELFEIVAALVVTYGYDCTSLSDADFVKSVNDFAQIAVNAVAPVYAASYADGVAKIDPASAYYDRLEHLNSIAVYSAFLESLKSSAFSNVEGLDYDKIEEDVAKVAAEEAALMKAKADTIEAVAAAVQIPDVYFATYADYRAVYDILFNHPICASYYDDSLSAETVNLASKVANVVLAEYPLLDAAATAFVTNVPIANNSTLGFAERYAAYVIAKENKFTDTSYNEFIEGTTIEEILAIFDSVDAELSVIVAYAEEFLSKVDDASKSLSYSVKNVLLDEAAAYIENVEIGYPGVPEAIELYSALRKDVSERVEATKSYIQAVIDVQNASTVADKKAAIEIAKGLATLGSDVSVEITGFDITVTEANIILSNEESAILLAESKISNYISAVDALADMTDLAEIRRGIANATALKANADASVAGVPEATAKLEAAIASFNARMNAANSELKEVSNVALSALGATVPTQRFGEIVAIIKKFYE